MSEWTLQGPSWDQTTGHQRWLENRAHQLLDYYATSLDPAGGFFDLDERHSPLPTGWPPAAERQTTLFQTTRMVHCYAIGHLWGRPGCADLVDHGMDDIWNHKRDTTHGGYFWTTGRNGVLDATKQAYGHAFVLLAASTAKLAGHPDADRLLADISEVIDDHFWEAPPGAMKEEFAQDWSGDSDYRGANSNMHSVEALLAAAEATGEHVYVERAMKIAELVIGEATQANDWRIPEHFHGDWSIDRDYDRDVFRPYGSTIGHWLEWSRLLLQLWIADGEQASWLTSAASTLFEKAMREGWDHEKGGFYFTVDWNGSPVDKDRYWWPCTEGIAAAYWLDKHAPGRSYQEAYRIIWSWSAHHLIDSSEGFWRHQLDSSLTPTSDPWYGCPDLYHALQATLIPTVPAASSLAAALAGRAGVKR